MHLQSIQTICKIAWKWRRPINRPTDSSLYICIEISFRVSDITKLSSSFPAAILPYCHRNYGTNVGWLFLCARMHVMNLISCRFLFFSKQSYCISYAKAFTITYMQSWFIQWPDRADLLCLSFLMFSLIQYTNRICSSKWRRRQRQRRW